jgi:hypothetical protein
MMVLGQYAKRLRCCRQRTICDNAVGSRYSGLLCAKVNSRGEPVEDRRSGINNNIVQAPDTHRTRDEARVSYADVVKNTSSSKNTNTHVGKPTGKLTTIRNNNILSRAHSLERIQ